MTRAIGRSAAAALLAGLLGAAFVALFYAWHPVLAIEFDRDFAPRSVSGIYGPERDDARGLTFAWTGGNAVVRLPGLDRRSDWTLDMRLRGGRANGNPTVEIFADGVSVGARETAPDWTDVQVAIPARRDRRGLVLELRSSSTFVPGPGDSRALGVMLDRLSLTPGAVALVPRPALEATGLASAAMGAALALLGVTAGSAIGGAVLLSAGAGAIVARGFGPFTDYPQTVTALGIWIGLALAALSLVRQYLTAQPLRNTARFAAAFASAALFLKLLVLLHPDMPIGDALFHAHRFQGVLAGKLFFTSIAPGGYAFPYPPGLYVFAAAFAGLVRRGFADVFLLRIVTCSVDAAVSVLLYWIVARTWGNRLAAAGAVAIYHVIPVDFAVLTTGNLTNAFAQSIAVIGLALMAATEVTPRGRGWLWTAALAAALAVAYLSHTSTIAILFAATIMTAVLFIWRGDAETKRGAAAILAATAAAAIVAVALYYIRFMDTYRTEFARIGHETASNASDAGGRTIGDRIGGVPYSLSINIGFAVLALAAGGAIARWRGRDRLTLAVAGWLAACCVFLAIGVMTPIDMRYYLAAVPALAVLAAAGGAWSWTDAPRDQRSAWRVGAAVLLAAALSAGCRFWWGALG